MLGHTTFRDASCMDPSKPSCFIPTLSIALTIIAELNPRTHKRAPRKQQTAYFTVLEKSLLNWWVFPSIFNLPPHSVHCIPNLSSNFSVRKKFRTEPRREKARVRPKARASSFPLNQKAVMRFWTTEEDEQKGKVGSLSRCWDGAALMGTYWSEIRSLIRTADGRWAWGEAGKEFLWSGSPAQKGRSPKRREKKTETPQLKKRKKIN